MVSIRQAYVRQRQRKNPQTYSLPHRVLVRSPGPLSTIHLDNGRIALHSPIKGRVRSSSDQCFSKNLSVHIATRRRSSSQSFWELSAVHL